jgi:23S rRNA (adenine2030-N6)-methyltransferase
LGRTRDPRSRYAGDAAAPDYRHRLHAGNVGDVWKHAVLVEVLGRAAASGARVAFLETHAGEGRYLLAATGEWSEGIGRLWTDPGEATEDALGRYLALCRRLGAGERRPEEYPGSPAFARAVLGPTAELVLWERDPEAVERLRAHVGEDPRARVVHGDGLAALAGELAALGSGVDGVIALIDPSYAAKSDWITVPDAIARAFGATGRASAILWYPVKSLTRPNAMLARLRAAGLAGTLAELVTTPLEHRRHRLNGSGVLLVRPPAGALAGIAALAPALGERCATTPGGWSFRMVSLGSPARA